MKNNFDLFHFKGILEKFGLNLIESKSLVAYGATSIFTEVLNLIMLIISVKPRFHQISHWGHFERSSRNIGHFEIDHFKSGSLRQRLNAKIIPSRQIENRSVRRSARRFSIFKMTYIRCDIFRNDLFSSDRFRSAFFQKWRFRRLRVKNIFRSLQACTTWLMVATMIMVFQLL